MSLVNDALRRGKQNGQGQVSPTSAGAPMEPVLTPERFASSATAKILGAFAFLLLVVAFFIWNGARTKVVTNNKSGEPVAPSVALQRPITPVPGVPQVDAPRSPASAVVSSIPLEPTNNVAAATSVAAPAPVAPPQLKLQGIFYRLNQSTALINGKTVGAGELIAGVRVVKIDRQSVTLEWNGQTNVLTME